MELRVYSVKMYVASQQKNRELRVISPGGLGSNRSSNGLFAHIFENKLSKHV